MAGTAVLTSPSFREAPVWERIITYTLTTTSGSDEIKFALPMNGILQKIICKVGAAAGITGTLTLAIDDNGDNEIFSVSSLAESSTNVYNVSEPLTGQIDIGVNPSDDPTSGTWVIVVTLRGI